MSELRHDPLSGRSVIVAAGRATRPHQFVGPAADETRDGDCPFCPGHETQTPPEVARTGGGAPDGPGWRVRVFPNLYPIVGGADAGPGASGAHEVVVLSPDHHRSFAQLDDDVAAEVLLVLRDRLRAHAAADHSYAVAIINHRRAAGASIAHPHAQVLALDFVPPAVVESLGLADAAGHDLVLADFADSDDGSLVVQREHAVAWCPNGSTSPALVRVAHPHGGARFDDAPDDEVAAVARTLRAVLRRLSSWLGDPPYNLVIHSAPPRIETEHSHWYVEITPRVSVTAGFEQATGVLVNTLPPDQAAAALRACAP